MSSEKRILYYRVFTRTWWRNNPSWPNGLEPSAGRKYTIGTHNSEDAARAQCQEWNATHNPGSLSRKAEYEAVYK